MIGGIAAVFNGVEILASEKDDAARQEAIDLIAFSAREARHRVQFYRVAFGLPGAGTIEFDLAKTRQLALDMFQDSRTSIDWPIDSAGSPTLFNDEYKYLLNLVLLAAESIPRGGTVTIGFSQRPGGNFVMELTAKGERAQLSETTRQALAGELTIAAVDARSVQPFYTARIDERLAARLTIETVSPDELRFTAAIPH